MKNHIITMSLLLASLALLTACTASDTPGQSAPPETNDVPAMQMAIVQTVNGGAEVLEYQSVPVREPGDGEVLIKIVAAAINPIDRRFREGAGPPRGGPPPGPPRRSPSGPSVPGSDLAGIVVKLGESVSNVNIGDAVFAKLAVGGGGLNGSYSEYAVASADQVVPKPTGQTYAQASGLATVGMTAMRTLDHVNVDAGQRVFINGIGGGIGSSAAQFSKVRGAYVLGTASAKHHEYLKSIGVDEVINYRDVQFDEVIEQPVDIVIETVGTDTANQALNILKPGGQLVSIAGPADADLCAAKAVTCSRIGGNIGRSNTELLREISQLAEAGLYTLNVDTTFPLQQAGAAQDLNHNVGTTGKIVLIVDPELAHTK